MLSEVDHKRPPKPSTKKKKKKKPAERGMGKEVLENPAELFFSLLARNREKK